MKELAIIILDWNGAEDTIECIKTLNNHSLYDIYLLDNGSKEDNNKIISDFLTSPKYEEISGETTLDAFKTRKNEITYIHSETNLGFAVGNNTVAKMICNSYRYILLLNNDTEVPSGTIESMLKTAKDKRTVALTCDIRVYYRKNELWNAGGYFTIFGERKYYSQKKIDGLKNKGVRYIDASFITGCALLVDAEHIRKHGLFTDKFFHGEEDFNLCYKLKKTHEKVGVDIGVIIYHKVGKTIQRIGENKSYNSMLVNYVNRTIDFKEFYGKIRWMVWREVYLWAITLVRIIKGMDTKRMSLMRKRIRKISTENENVKKQVFDIIMQMTW